MSAYAKSAPGERLTYAPPDLWKYEGEQFCLRITPDDFDLERCFFVYLDESYEDYSIGKLLQTFFISPSDEHQNEIMTRVAAWYRVDPSLTEKYFILSELIRWMRGGSGQMVIYINNGPGPINDNDMVRTHLGTSVFDDGSFNDKILDIVLEFHFHEDEPFFELEQWAEFDPSRTVGVTGPTARVKRRSALGKIGLLLVAIFAFPLLFFSCRGENNGGGGFGGGML